MKNTYIYPSITSISGIEKVKDKIKEATELNLKEVCFFPTRLSFEERQEFYLLLKKSPITYVPLVHLKDDMTKDEIKFFQTHYKTKSFNVHSSKEFPLPSLSKEFMKKNVYLETTTFDLSEEISSFAGVCADFSHIEYWKKCKSPLYDAHLNILNNYPCNVAHISASFPEGSNSDEHWAEDNHNFDYLLNYSKYLPEICALEIENPISEQLKFIVYLKSYLKI